MTHVAIAEKDDGKSVTWEEKVSDADYQAALVSAGVAATKADGTKAATRHWPTSDTLSGKRRAIPLMAAAMPGSDMRGLAAAPNQSF